MPYGVAVSGGVGQLPSRRDKVGRYPWSATGLHRRLDGQPTGPTDVLTFGTFPMGKASVHDPWTSSMADPPDACRALWIVAPAKGGVDPYAAMAKRRGGAKVSQLIHSLDHQTAR
jgi:hypothetical protein